MKASNKGGGDFDIEAGIYNAVCFGLIDLGTQHGEYKGVPNSKRQIIAKFELLDELYEYEGEEHRSQFSMFYTLSLHEKATLRKHLKGWRGKEFTAEELAGFEMKNVLGKNCTLVIGTKENGKSTIESITKFKGAPVAPERELEYFSFEDFDGTFPAWMSEGIKKICMKSDEYAEFDMSGVDQPDKPKDEIPMNFDDDDVPF